MATNKNIYFFAIALAVVINLFSWDLPFFWDTILTSTITQYFFEHGFQNFITPAQFDAGHPPLFYIYVTFFYFLLGKNLFAAHLSMLPFTLLGILSFIKILQHFQVQKKTQFVGLILFFSIPAVITQYSLVSYDAVLLSLYLTAILLILKNRKILFALVIIGIVGISLRGIFCIVALSITIYFLEKRNLKTCLKWNLYFAPAIVIIAIWLFYHHAQTGWYLSTNAENWKQQRGFVNGFGLLKNSFSIARCLFDLGIALLSLLSIFYFIQKRKFDTYTLLWLIPFIIFSISFLPFSNPINHRYFLIVYVLMLLPILNFLSDKKIIFSIMTIIILIVGNFLVYPIPISNAWDCTLVFTSYVSAKDDFDNLNARGFSIDKAKIGTVFPMNASLKQTNLYQDSIRLINVNNRSLDSIQFVLFSNIGNDFSDEQIKEIKKWEKLAVFNRRLVFMTLYMNPKNNPKNTQK